MLLQVLQLKLMYMYNRPHPQTTVPNYNEFLWTWILLISTLFQPENFAWGPKWPLKSCFRSQFFGRKGANRTIQGIDDVVNDQRFAMHYRAISNMASHLEVFWCERTNTAKQKDGLTSFFMLSVLEEKMFQHGFLEEHKVCEHNCYWKST